LHKGSFFGERNLLDVTIFGATATVEAEVHCELELLPFDSLREMMQTEAELTKALKAQARAAYVRNSSKEPRIQGKSTRKHSHLGHLHLGRPKHLGPVLDFFAARKLITADERGKEMLPEATHQREEQKNEGPDAIEESASRPCEPGTVESRCL
jgi:hypothetical protein